MSSWVQWGREYAGWFQQMVLAPQENALQVRSATLARLWFPHVINHLCASWRECFPDEPPPLVPRCIQRHGEAHRVIDAFQRALADRHSRQESPPAGQGWEFRPGEFRYNGSKWHRLRPQSLDLLKAFVNAPDHTRSHDQINRVCNNDCDPRHERYVSELRSALRKRLKLTANPIQPLTGHERYRLVLTSEKSEVFR
jgi:hypothetical protein